MFYPFSLSVFPRPLEPSREDLHCRLTIDEVPVARPQQLDRTVHLSNLRHQSGAQVFKGRFFEMEGSCQ